ncbi:MAG: hypothetical protein ACRDRS_20950 [Pseudonocardiaceae bacterium]
MLKRASIIMGLSLAVLMVSSAPALAGGWWDTVDCSQNPNPGCELSVGKGGDGAHRYSGNPARKPRPGARGDHPDGGDHIVGADNKLVHCSYVRSDYQPPTTGVTTIAYQMHGENRAVTVRPAVFSPVVAGRSVRAAADPVPGQPGAWYVYKCDGAGVSDAVYRAPVWIPDGQPGAPSPEQLAEQARSQLLLPSPRIEANPVGAQLVNLPTWLWLDGAGWGERSASAEVPGVSVTAVARPISVTWLMGDGGSVTCPGQGTPFPVGGDPKAVSPDCGHLYRSSSAGQPGQAFPVIATVHWTVTWAGAGQSGTFPDLATSATGRFRVSEAQALVNGTG